MDRVGHGGAPGKEAKERVKTEGKEGWAGGCRWGGPRTGGRRGDAHCAGQPRPLAFPEVREGGIQWSKGEGCGTVLSADGRGLGRMDAFEWVARANIHGSRMSVSPLWGPAGLTVCRCRAWLFALFPKASLEAKPGVGFELCYAWFLT